jgi:hypothetical protein
MEGGSTRLKQLEMEQRLAAIERKLGMGSGLDARAQVRSLQHQLALARAAMQAMLKSQQDKELRAVHQTSKDIQRNLRRHIIREALPPCPSPPSIAEPSNIPQVCAAEWRRTWLRSG